MRNILKANIGRGDFSNGCKNFEQLSTRQKVKVGQLKVVYQPENHVEVFIYICTRSFGFIFSSTVYYTQSSCLFRLLPDISFKNHTNMLHTCKHIQYTYTRLYLCLQIDLDSVGSSRSAGSSRTSGTGMCISRAVTNSGGSKRGSGEPSFKNKPPT